MNKKIVDYCVVLRADATTPLEIGVMELIRDGWEPIGGVSVHIQDGYTYYAQAMVRYVESEN